MDELKSLDKLLDQAISTVLEDTKYSFHLKPSSMTMNQADSYQNDIESSYQNDIESSDENEYDYSLTEDYEVPRSKQSQHWTDKSHNKNLRDNKPKSENVRDSKTFYQGSRNDKYDSIRADQSMFEDMLRSKSQHRVARNDKYKAQREEKSEYDEILGKNSQYNDVWDENFKVPKKENKSVYEEIPSKQSQYRDEWNDKYKAQREDMSDYEDILGNKSQYHDDKYKTSRKDESDYQTSWIDKSEYSDRGGGKSKHQDSWSNESQYYKKPTKDISNHQFLKDGHSEYRTLSEQSNYQGQDTSKSQYNVPRPEQNQYQTNSAYTSQSQTSRYEQPEASRLQRQERQDNIQKKTTFPSWKDSQDFLQKQQSFQERYEQFRSQRKSFQNKQSSNKQSTSKDIYDDEMESRNTYKSPNNNTYSKANQHQDINTVQADSDTEHPTSEAREEKQSVQVLDNTEEDDTKEKLKLVSRKLWGALPTLVTLPPFQAPANTIVFSVSTGTSPCDTPKECMRRVREVQARHMGEGLGDIQYSFLLGGDGYVYEGRGVDFESGTKKEGEEGPNISIAFIGKYNNENVPKLMVTNAHILVQSLQNAGMIRGVTARMETKKLK